MMLIAIYTTPRRRSWIVAVAAFLIGAGATLLLVAG